MKRKTFIRLILTLLVISAQLGVASAQLRQKVITRVFWQDRETQKLSYADLLTTNRWLIRRGEIAGFPTLDTEKQSLVQMKHSDGVLLVGVRDSDNGEVQSGWVSIDTGVVKEPHGNHSHWRYKRKPTAGVVTLDDDQGNPAHVYVYDRQFYVANDKKNGFTRANPTDLLSRRETAATFSRGGGNHITLAAVENSLVYSTWIDGGGPHAGQVDVVNLKAPSEVAYSFKLPSGVIHGATHNSGRVFFAPADGICWVDADLKLQESGETVSVNHIPLGTDPETDQPLRTGAFENMRNWVLFSTGSADKSALCLIDAAADSPKLIKVNIDVADGLKLMTPKCVLSLGRRYAFLFQDRTDADSDIPEKLTIVELDPNRDRDFKDARLKATISVGPSKVEGHHGHHAITFDAFGRHAVFTEPATGMLNVMALPSMRIVARFRVGGVPHAIQAVGASEHFH